MSVKIEEIELVDIKDLRPHPKNPNAHSKDQIERLSQLLEYQGFRQPIVVSRLSGFIVAGHGRLEAAKKLGITEVPVSYQDFDTEDQEYAYLVSDNAIASWSELDLAAINAMVPDLGPDFNIDMLGIKHFVMDISELMADLDDKEKKDEKGGHFLEVECTSESEMLEIYEELLARGIIVRCK